MTPEKIKKGGIIEDWSLRLRPAMRGYGAINPPSPPAIKWGRTILRDNSTGSKRTRMPKLWIPNQVGNDIAATNNFWNKYPYLLSNINKSNSQWINL